MKKSLRWRVAQFCEARWWKRYLADKDVDAYLHKKKNYWQHTLDELKNSVELVPGQTSVLDAGCGPAG